MMVPRKSVLFCLVFGLVLYAGQVRATKQITSDLSEKILRITGALQVLKGKLVELGNQLVLVKKGLGAVSEEERKKQEEERKKREAGERKRQEEARKKQEEERKKREEEEIKKQEEAIKKEEEIFSKPQELANLSKICPHVKIYNYSNACWFHSSLQCFFKTKELTEKLLANPAGIEVVCRKAFPWESDEVTQKRSRDETNLLKGYVRLLINALKLKSGEELKTEDFYNLWVPEESRGQMSEPKMFWFKFRDLIESSSLFKEKGAGDKFIKCEHGDKDSKYEFNENEAPKILLIVDPKILTNKKFTDETLVCSAGDKKYQYTLYAMAVGANWHFWAYGKDWNPNGKWWYYDDLGGKAIEGDDDHVKEITETRKDTKHGGKDYPVVYFYRRDDEPLKGDAPIKYE